MQFGKKQKNLTSVFWQEKEAVLGLPKTKKPLLSSRGYVDVELMVSWLRSDSATQRTGEVEYQGSSASTWTK
jgi:hypothetical protein